MHTVQNLSLALLALSAAPSLAAEPPLAARCEAEIVELHQFLEQWSNAELPDSDHAYSRFADVLAESFLLVDADGALLARQPVVTAIRGAHGRWQSAPGQIRIENVQLHHHHGDLALATYEEWHDFPDHSIGRLSSVLFGQSDSAPNGLEWLHLHEVWIDSGANGD